MRNAVKSLLNVKEGTSNLSSFLKVVMPMVDREK